MFKLIKYLKGYTAQSIIAPLFKFLEASFELIVPVVMAQIIDVGIKNQDKAHIYKMGFVLIILGILGLAAAITAQFFAAKASVGFGTALRRDFYRHLNSLSHAETDRLGAPTMITRITNDINQAQTGVNMFLRLFLRSPFIVIGSIVMCLTISVKLTLIFAVAAPVIGLIIYLIMTSTIPRYKMIQGRLDKVSLSTGENLSGVRVIRAFSKQKSEKADFENETEELLKAQVRVGRISALLNPLTFVVVNLAIAAILWFGGSSVDIGEITQGELIALVNYMNQILLALIYLANLIIILTKAGASAARINDVFAIKASVTDEGNTEQTAVPGAPAVEFKNVTFAYHKDKPSLENISFTAFEGETVGIIGGTGSGKTTLVNLIPRFYDVSEGEVLVDGVDVKKYPFGQLRGKIGIVPQRASLFKGTVRSNLLWGNKSATDEEMWQALETARAAEFVKKLPQGLDAPVEQGGRNFSGGQRQRLTIARAVIMKPHILILDDSASALDFATDAALRKALANDISKAAVFIVSQRAAGIKHADKIIVLDDGKPVGIGTHKDLFNSCQIYREICLSQMSEQEAQNG
ncbi:MAG: ABC transporter ATP-binding protein/permease [Ruminiclostridium sp.]|nr:ABC transporter ATP-binding protein/permease [Ruminiclostridium sp.]